MTSGLALTNEERLKHAFEMTSDRLRDHLVELEAEIAAAFEAEREEVRRDVQPIVLDDPPARPEVQMARLLDGIRSIGRARSLSEILDTLTSCAGREAPRVALVLTASGRFRGWRFIGFDGGFENPDTIEFGPDDAGVIQDALRTEETTTSDGNGTTHAPNFSMLPAGRTSVAVPIVLGQEAVAVLYADAGSEDAAEQHPSGDGIVHADALEILTRHAARCLEAVTAFKTASLLKDQFTGNGRHPAPRNFDEPPDEDGAARRYARLLVSEIKLYHEAEVLAGRRERDLATRLGGEIARARVLYEQRVPDRVRRRGDHFHAELVRTLADGDASLLEHEA